MSDDGMSKVVAEVSFLQQSAAPQPEGPLHHWPSGLRGDVEMSCLCVLL